VSQFRTLLWWLLLAAFGALAYDLLSLDVGELVLRWHGFTVSTTVAFALVAWLVLWVLLWALWTLFNLPFTGWQRLAQRQARNRLVNGLVALHDGRHARAVALLERAAEDRDSAAVARIAAREAALRQDDHATAAAQQAALGAIDPLNAALNAARALLAQGQPRDALDVLQPHAERRNLPPRAQQLRGMALVAAGRAAEALPLLPALEAERTLGPDAFAALERQWQAAALTQAAHAHELSQRWQAVIPRTRASTEVLLAYAQRAGELGMEQDAERELGAASDARWDEALVRAYGLLPAPRDAAPLARAQGWLGAHPTSAALALTLGRLARRESRWAQAEEALHRAVASGGGAEAWEELGNVFTAEDRAEAAQLCYANALRTARGERARPLGGRSLRDQIADEAVAELRDEHGFPRLGSEHSP
jgi:HemY protein